MQCSSCCIARVAGWRLQILRGNEAKWPLCSEVSNTTFCISTKNVGVVAIFESYA